MVNKTLLYKFEYYNIDEDFLPKFSPEEIGHILLTIEKGIIKGPMTIPVFSDGKYILNKFPVSFRNVIEGTRLDITYIYTLKTPEYNRSGSKIIGSTLFEDKQKVDIVSFFTKVKDSKSEHKIYQIGGRYSEAMEDARIFDIEMGGKSKEELLKELEKIRGNNEFKSYHPSKKFYYLNKLRELYRQAKNDKLYWKIQREIERNFSKSLESKILEKGSFEIDKNPFNVSLEKFEFLKKEKVQVPRTKSLLYKNELEDSSDITEISIDNVAGILVDIQMIPHYVDVEEKPHQVNFRGIVNDTRKDLIFHYVHLIPLYDHEKTDENGFALLNGYEAEDIIKVDIVSFISEINEGNKEHRIYQIGARYKAENLTFDDLYGLGDANYELEYYNKALEFFNKALALKPNESDTLVFKGLTLVCLEEYETAIELYKEVLKREPDDPITWDNLGIAYDSMGNKEKAKEAFKKAFELDPEDEDIKEHYNDCFNN